MNETIEIPETIKRSNIEAFRIASVGNCASSDVYLMDGVSGMKHYPDNYFDLAIVDPPYNIGGDSLHSNRHLKDAGKLKNRAINKFDTKWDNEAPTEAYFLELFRVSKNQIIWGGNYFGMLPKCRCFIVWDKEQPWENFSACEYAWTSFDKPSKIFRQPTTRTGENKIHPTQKSVKLYDWIFKKFANENDNILDTHLGSGSSRIAANKANLDFTGFEIDEDYFNAQEKRYKDFISQTRLF